MVTSGAACTCDQKKILEKRSHLYNGPECEGAQSIGVGWGGAGAEESQEPDLGVPVRLMQGIWGLLQAK